MNKKIQNNLILIATGALFAFSQLGAKDIPIVDSLALSVATEKAVIEFPFKITGISPDEFIPKESSSTKMPEIKKGENVLEISAASPGKMKTIIWGADHPMFLELDFEKSGEKYYKFTSPIGENNDIQNMEGNPHEDVVSDLVISAFNEKMPKGYTSKSRHVTGNSDFISWEFQLEYSGSNYSVQSWKVKNTSKKAVRLYEEMFASEKNKIYGISIEAPDLNPEEATRVFIVKKAEDNK